MYSPRIDLPPCTCHLVLLGRADQCKRELIKARRSSVPADDPTKLNEFKQSRENFRRHSTGGTMEPSQLPNDTYCPLAQNPAQNENPGQNENGPGEVRNAPARKPSKEERMVQRKWSKKTTLRMAARTATAGSLQDRSPRAPWDKFLKHFDRIQLEVIYEQFEAADIGCTGDIGVDDALEILAGWNAAEYDLQTVKPGEDAVQDVLVALGGGVPIARLNFDFLVKFMRLCEAKVLQADPKAGFKKDDMQFLQNIFETHSKSRLRINADGSMSDETRYSLNTADVFAVLQDMGRDTSEADQQIPIRNLIIQMDVDGSGDLDFQEYLQFARRVRMMDAEEERELERKLVCSSEFSYTENEELLLLFQKYDESEAGVLKVYQFVDLVESNDAGNKLDKQAKANLIKQVQEFGCLEEEDDTITLGQFLLIMKKLIDQDVCGLMTSIQKAEFKMQEDERYLAPEDYEKKYQSYFGISKTSWLIRNLIDNKVDKNALRFERKRASKERLTQAMKA